MQIMVECSHTQVSSALMVFINSSLAVSSRFGFGFRKVGCRCRSEIVSLEEGAVAQAFHEVKHSQIDNKNLPCTISSVL